MITLYTSFSQKEFSASVPDVEMSITGTRVNATVNVSKSGEVTEIYSEYLYPDVTRRIKLTDLDILIEPYANRWLTFDINVGLIEETVTTDTSGNETVTRGDTRKLSSQIISCRASIRNLTAEQWCSTRFLTLLDGPRVTAPGFLEYLYCIGPLSGSPYYRAYYDDGSSVAMACNSYSMGDHYIRIDASPNNFTSSGRKLMRYTIYAEQRSQEYVVNHDIAPDVAPVLLFWNSFGVQELAYCTGEFKEASSFERKQARIGRLKQTYSMEEKATFKADTGFLTFPMAAWWRDVLRSMDIRVLGIRNGGVDTLNQKEVVIVSDKDEMSNAPDHMPRITFEYEYADRNHNIFDVRQEGRIFDDTFDYTFN